MDTEKQNFKKSLQRKDREFYILGKYREFPNHGHGETEKRN